MHSQKRWGAAAFGEDFADTVAGGFGSDHADVDGLWRLNSAEANVEAVGKHQGFAGREMRLDPFFVNFGLTRVRRENHDDVGPGSGFRGSLHGDAIFFGASARRAAFGKS